jgi:hypothetical protein
MSFVTLKRIIRASLNLVDPLARDGMNIGRRDQISRASVLKHSNLLGHGKLSFGVTLNILIGSRLND